MSFPVVDVSSWELVDFEPVGREEKLWIRHPDARHGTRTRDWLFKPVVVTSAGHRQGEDWAEKLAAELAGLLGLPRADVELAVRTGTPGLISRNVAPDGWGVISGGSWLGTRNAAYRARRKERGRPGHSLSAIISSLASVGVPAEAGLPDAPAVFAGYLLLDAWIGNQDRHDQNWAVLREIEKPGRVRLAASFDHASSLGFQRRDSFREAALRNGLGTFVSKARAHRFEHDPNVRRQEIQSLVELARGGLAAVPAAGSWWDRLAAVRATTLADIVAAVPGLSDVTATFILEMLRLNRERLLDVR